MGNNERRESEQDTTASRVQPAYPRQAHFLYSLLSPSFLLLPTFDPPKAPLDHPDSRDQGARVFALIEVLLRKASRWGACLYVATAAVIASACRASLRPP